MAGDRTTDQNIDEVYYNGLDRSGIATFVPSITELGSRLLEPSSERDATDKIKARAHDIGMVYPLLTEIITNFSSLKNSWLFDTKNNYPSSDDFLKAVNKIFSLVYDGSAVKELENGLILNQNNPETLGVVLAAISSLAEGAKLSVQEKKFGVEEIRSDFNNTTSWLIGSLGSSVGEPDQGIFHSNPLVAKASADLLSKLAQNGLLTKEQIQKANETIDTKIKTLPFGSPIRDQLEKVKIELNKALVALNTETGVKEQKPMGIR